MKAALLRLLNRSPAALENARRFRRWVSRFPRSVRNSLPGALRLKTNGLHNEIRCSQARLVRGTTVVVIGGDNLVTFDDGAHVDGCEIVVRGDGNRIVIGASSFWNLTITISGCGNQVAVADGCVCRGLGLVCEDDGNVISIGARTEVAGATEMAAMEGTRLSVGEECLFSGGVHIRTGDSHSLVDLENRRINPSKDVSIGDHVWVGMQVTILKGVSVAGHSVIAACAVVTRRFESPNCAIGGNPAKVIREGVDWLVERVGMG